MKYTITIPLLVLLATLMAPGVLGVLANTIGTEVSPTASANAIKGTYNFSVNYNTTATNGGGTVQNVTVYVGTITACNTVIGNSTTIANASCTYDTTGAADATYTITFSLWLTNGTNEVNDTVTGVVIDNTAPTAVVVADFDKVEPLKLFTTDCSDSTDNLGTALNYTQNLTKPSGVVNNDTTTTGIAEWSETEIDEKGEYTMTCLVTDAGSNTATQTLTIRVADRGLPPEVIIGKSTRTTGTKSGGGMFLLFAGGLILTIGIGIFALWLAMGKKK